MSEWQPIETAPKDGTEVLVFCEGKRLIAHWGEIVRDYWVWCSLCGFRQNSPVTVLGPEHDIDGNQNHFHLKGPTHWQPLPEPPVKP